MMRGENRRQPAAHSQTTQSICGGHKASLGLWHILLPQSLQQNVIYSGTLAAHASSRRKMRLPGARRGKKDYFKDIKANLTG